MRHYHTRVVNDEENQANLSASRKAKIDKKKVRLKKNTKLFGIALNDSHNTKRFYLTKKERLKKFYEYRREYPKVKILSDNYLK